MRTGHGSGSGKARMADRCDGTIGGPPAQASDKAQMGGRFDVRCFAPGRLRSGVVGAVVERLTEAHERLQQRRQHVAAGMTSRAIHFARLGLVPYSMQAVFIRAAHLAMPKPGELLWQDTAENIVVNQGRDDILTQYFKASGYTAAHYVGLMSATPTLDPTDTLASKAWTEITQYSEPARQQYVTGTVSGGSIDNSGAKAVVTASAGFTTGGAFLATDSTKGGTTGTLYCEAAYSGGNKTLAIGETLAITYTNTAADDGA